MQTQTKTNIKYVIQTSEIGNHFEVYNHCDMHEYGRSVYNHRPIEYKHIHSMNKNIIFSKNGVQWKDSIRTTDTYNKLWLFGYNTKEEAEQYLNNVSYYADAKIITVEEKKVINQLTDEDFNIIDLRNKIEQKTLTDEELAQMCKIIKEYNKYITSIRAYLGKRVTESGVIDVLVFNLIYNYSDKSNKQHDRPITFFGLDDFLKYTTKITYYYNLV